MNLRTPLATARGLGSAHSGVHHWWVQRLTAVALIPLTIWFVWIGPGLLAADFDSARAFVGAPFNALLLAAFVVALFWHAQLGLQVVIEDYVHTRWLEISLQVLVKFAAVLGTLASLLALVRITLGN